MATITKTAKQAEIIRTALVTDKLPTALRPSLNSYATTQNFPHNEDFVKTIVALRPEWLPTRSTEIKGSFATNKKALLLMAAAGWNKPHAKTKVGTALINYCSTKHKNHDAVFAATIKALRPDWFGGERVLP
jgi:hypothetical protein